MTTVAIIPENGQIAATSYRAIAGKRFSVGRTAGEALDALTSQLEEGEKGTLIVVQHMHSDVWFNADQRQRLQDLMARWRAARDGHVSLSPQEQEELDLLVAAELQAANDRAAALVHEINS